MLPLDNQFGELIEELKEKGENYRIVYRKGKHLVTRGQGKDDKVAATVQIDELEEE